VANACIFGIVTTSTTSTGVMQGTIILGEDD
jgi:hypothetical protein